MRKPVQKFLARFGYRVYETKYVNYLEKLRADLEDCALDRVPGRLAFQCNICGERTSENMEEMKREVPLCEFCSSNVRFRAVIHHLSQELFGESLPLVNFPHRPDITGAGLSDWSGYALPLAEKLNYTNTFYDHEPLLDITQIDSAQENMLDFLIASDVFEHIAPPVSRAFENAYRLLKPGGLFILTVPYVNEGETREYYPNLHEYHIEEHAGERVLLNRTSAGAEESFTGLVFHHGEGETLEMRLFSKASLLEELQRAGFTQVRVAEEHYFRYGIYWSRDRDLPILARKA